MKIFATAARLAWRILEVARARTPIKLVTLSQQGVITRFAICRRDIEFPASSGIIYSGALAGLSPFSYSSDLSPLTVTLGMKINQPQYKAAILSSRVPEMSISVIQVFHENLSTGVYEDKFRGTLRSISADSASLLFDFVSTTYRLQNNLLRISTKAGCNHRTFSPGCGLSRNGSYLGLAFKHTTTISAINPATRQVSLTSMSSSADISKTYPDGYFSDGVMETTIPDSTFVDRLHILSQTANVLQLVILPSFLEVGATVDLLAGDDFTHATCLARFGNLNRFKGMPIIPLKNPTIDGVNTK